MATRAIRPKRDEGPLSSAWQPIPERAPSLIRVERPLVARIFAFAGVCLVFIGGLAMILAATGRPYVIGPNAGFFWFTVGLLALIFHAFRDPEVGYRRVYSGAGFMLLIVGAVLRVYPWKGTTGGLFLIYGLPCLFVGALFSIAVVRHETDVFRRTYVLRLLGILGGLMILAGLIGGNLHREYLESEGSLLLLLGTLFVGAYIGLQDPGGQEGYRAGLAVGAVAVLGFVIALLRSVGNEAFLVPYGFTLMGACLIYFAIALGTCSEARLVVLTRRELSALFYSPIAYFVLIAMIGVSFLRFNYFLQILEIFSTRANGIEEPFVRNYFIDFWTVLTVIVVVPVLTMRLLSEEKRSGTLEVLLTAPVNESAIVLSKFVAVLVFFLISFLPWFVFLVMLRVVSGVSFEYRPALNFIITLVFTGGSLMSAGLFFSSLTRNQIVAAVITFLFMAIYTYLSQFFMERIPEAISYVSYLDLWLKSLGGQFAPRFLLFHFSLTLFFLFLTTKVLEARKWT